MINTQYYPLIYTLTKEEIIEKISELAKAYTPEWRFHEEEPDIGSVIALIYADLLKDSIDIVNQSIFKHHIAFLNCLETDLRPAIPAQSYVTFEVVPTTDKGVFVCKGTKVMARAKDGEDVTFTTCHSVYASNLAPTDLLFTSKTRGQIISAYAGDTPLYDLNLKAFDFTGENVQQHAFFIAHPSILSETSQGNLKIHLKSAAADVVGQLLDEKRIEWCLLYEEGFRPVKAVAEEGGIVLQLETIPDSIPSYQGIENYWIGAFVKDYSDVPDITVQDIALSIRKQDLVPDTVYAQDIQYTDEAFCPFGNPLQLYSECYIRCDEAFAKQGAHIVMSFELDYLTRENKMFMPEKEVDFKYIMKKPPKKSEPEPATIKVDEAVWEYWNGRGWVRLLKEHQYSCLFNGRQSGKLTAAFTCPRDIEPIAVNAYEARWVRIRMLRAENIYTMPSVEHIPRVSNLRIAYDYDEQPQKPTRVFLKNNTNLSDVTYELTNRKEVTLFETCPYPHPSLFIGFDALPKQSPMCLFFNIDNPSIAKTPSLSFEYSAIKNHKPIFKGLKVSDGTKGFKSSGNFMIVFPPDFAKYKLFSKEKYWIKIENYTDEYDNTKRVLPHIQGIYMNTARVTNTIEAEESYYITETQGITKFKLNASNIIQTEVYINEKPSSPKVIEELLDNPMYAAKPEKDDKGNIEALWIKWQQCDSETKLERESRNYYVNQMTQEIIFPSNIFTRIPVNLNVEAVKVKYQICDGTRANVAKEEISIMQEPIAFINRIYNPVESFGSNDFETIEAAITRSAKLLNHREKVVTIEDYEEIVQGYSAGIKRVKCIPHFNMRGEPEKYSVTLAVLTEDYNKGSHTFSTYKEELEKYLLERSEITLLGHNLYLREPLFIKLAARVWIQVDDMEKAYEYQQTIKEAVSEFFDPISGYFDKKGWEIGALPKTNQLDAYLKSLRLECMFEKIILTAQVPIETGYVEKALEDLEEIPFAMATSGNHHIIVDLKERR